MNSHKGVVLHKEIIWLWPQTTVRTKAKPTCHNKTKKQTLLSQVQLNTKQTVLYPCPIVFEYHKDNFQGLKRRSDALIINIHHSVFYYYFLIHIIMYNILELQGVTAKHVGDSSAAHAHRFASADTTELSKTRIVEQCSVCPLEERGSWCHQPQRHH